MELGRPLSRLGRKTERRRGRRKEEGEQGSGVGALIGLIQIIKFRVDPAGWDR